MLSSSHTINSVMIRNRYAPILHALVRTCREDVLTRVRHYPIIQPYLHTLCDYYSDLQVHKHVVPHERVPRRANVRQYEKDLPKMEWYEFSACADQTLGIFCLVAYALQPDFTEKQAKQIYESYFPYIQGLHILLDYLIDQEEDRLGGDLNFCYIRFSS
ncbi:tetraprenyl-beta-curcumene synthase [Bacillus safensis FO-36b] [Bacillus safensis subsp. safensis]